MATPFTGSISRLTSSGICAFETNYYNARDFRRSRECLDLWLEDGSVRTFINTKGINKEDFTQEFLDFMEYIGKTTDENAAAFSS